MLLTPGGLSWPLLDDLLLFTQYQRRPTSYITGWHLVHAIQLEPLYLAFGFSLSEINPFVCLAMLCGVMLCCKCCAAKLALLSSPRSLASRSATINRANVALQRGKRPLSAMATAEEERLGCFPTPARCCRKQWQ